MIAYSYHQHCPVDLIDLFGGRRSGEYLADLVCLFGGERRTCCDLAALAWEVADEGHHLVAAATYASAGEQGSGTPTLIGAWSHVIPVGADCVVQLLRQLPPGTGRVRWDVCVPREARILADLRERYPREADGLDVHDLIGALPREDAP